MSQPAGHRPHVQLLVAGAGHLPPALKERGGKHLVVRGQLVDNLVHRLVAVRGIRVVRAVHGERVEDGTVVVPVRSKIR